MSALFNTTPPASVKAAAADKPVRRFMRGTMHPQLDNNNCAVKWPTTRPLGANVLLSRCGWNGDMDFTASRDDDVIFERWLPRRITCLYKPHGSPVIE